MTSLTTDSSQPNTSDPLDYLRVDAFLVDYAAVQALNAALNLGLIDALIDEGDISLARVEKLLGENGEPRILLDMLTANNVTRRAEQCWALTESFKGALPYRDFLVSKIEFANLISPDLLRHFDLFVTDMRAFMDTAEVFELFGYHRCFEMTEENITATRRWMRFTTCLTRHEARVIAQQADFSGYQRVLDIGGNSGEFVLQLCKAYPQLDACVVDLPVVCAIGKEHVSNEPEAQRISFEVCDALRDPLPTGQDLITFKSILHDWPLEAVDIFLRRAVEVLPANGTVMICERGPLDLQSQNLDFSMIPMLLFNRSFRTPDHYMKKLAELGLTELKLKAFELDTMFYLIEARKP